MILRLAACAFSLLPTSLVAQLSGTYSIDPAGSGSRNFRSFKAASYALFLQGVSAAVQFDIAAGIHTQEWILYPVVGASVTNTVVFRSPKPGAAILVTSGVGVSVYGFGTERARWIVFEGLTFRAATSSSSYAMRLFGDDLIVRDCEFNGVRLESRGDRLEIDHCRFTGDATPFEISGEGGSVHHCEIRMTNSRGKFPNFLADTGRDRLRVYNNLFTGVLTGSASYAMAIGGPTDFIHNTVAVLSSGTPVGYPTVYVLSRFAMMPVLSNNIIVNFNGGSLVNISGNHSVFDVRLSSNLYWATRKTKLFYSSNTGSCNTLACWKLATRQDGGSVQADPKFKNTASSPGGFMVQDGSAAVAAAGSSPAYITDDFAGVPRKTPATIGGYEGFPRTTFELYGKGCPGTGNHIPVLGYTGTLQMGSTNFAVTLRRALGGVSIQTWFAIGATKVKLNFGGACDLLAAPDLVYLTGVSGTGPGNGTASLQFNLPIDPRLKGVAAHLQYGVIDAGASAGVAFSNAAILTL